MKEVFNNHRVRAVNVLLETNCVVWEEKFVLEKESVAAENAIVRQLSMVHTLETIVRTVRYHFTIL